MNTEELKKAEINFDLSIEPGEKTKVELKAKLEGSKKMLVFFTYSIV